MKERLVLLGGGGHCKSVANTIFRSGLYNEVVILDQKYPQLTDVLGIPVVGNDDKLEKLKEIGFYHAFVTIGSIKSTTLRHMLYEKMIQFGFDSPYIVDPSAQVSEYALLESGVFIGQNVVVNAEAHIGKMAIINTGALVEHECLIGEYSHIAVGSKLCGNVTVGDNTLIGAGAVVVQGVQIGNRVLVGAGSIVLQDVQDDQMVTGLVK